MTACKNPINLNESFKPNILPIFCENIKCRSKRKRYKKLIKNFLLNLFLSLFSAEQEFSLQKSWFFWKTFTKKYFPSNKLQTASLPPFSTSTETFLITRKTILRYFSKRWKVLNWKIFFVWKNLGKFQRRDSFEV